MQGGFFQIENSKIIGSAKARVSSPYFLNAINTLSGTFECNIAEPSEVLNKSVYQSVKENDEINVYFTDGLTRFLVMKGLVVFKRVLFDKNKYYFSIGVSHKTYLMQKVPVEPFETTNKQKNANEVIRELFKKSKCDKLYDRLIPFRSGLTIDDNTYTANENSVYSVFEKMVNDISGGFFTTTIGNDSVFYLYDRGLSLKNEQTITNQNLLSFNLEIDYMSFVDDVDVSADGTIGTPLDMRNVGQTAIERKPVNKNRQYSNINAFGLQTLKRNINRVDLPRKVLRKRMSSSSNAIDSKEYSELLLREAFNEAVRIECTMSSFFIDLKNKQKGIWELGGRVKIENSELFNLLKDEFSLYLQNDDKYHFVIKQIATDKDYNVKIVLGLSDLIKIN